MVKNPLEDNLTNNSNVSSQSNDIAIVPLNSDKLIPKSQGLARRIPKKLGAVVLIDLTNDDMQKKKARRRLSWVQATNSKKIPSSTQEEITTQDSHTLDLSLFVTTDGVQSETINEEQQKEPSALDVDGLSLIEWSETIESEPSTHTEAPETDDIVIPSFVGFSVTSDGEEGEITIENDAFESDIKVQMEVQNELEVTTTENTELTCDDNISENVKNAIIDDTTSKSTNLVSEYQRDTVLHINHRLEESRREEMLESSPEKIRNVELQEQHIDGLSLLAIVSQSVSDLRTAKTSGHTNNPTREIIKVKDYKSLTEFASTNPVHSYANNAEDLSSSPVEMYPDDDIDKVAFQIEVSSSEDVSDHCTSTLYHPQILDKLPNEDINECPDTSADSSMQSEREEMNVILNGETLLLYQKSPKGKLYIINKTVENQESEETSNLSEKVSSMEAINDVNYPYEIYDKMYRIPQPSVPKTYDHPRRAQTIKVTTSNDSGRAIDLQKSSMKKTSGIEVKSPRRHRIRQEFNGCTSDIVDPHSIHIPATTSLYHANYPTPELYISCRQNCTSVTCGLPVNHPAPSMHSSPNASRCTCLNCRYDIVTHCTQCIIPPVEAQPANGIDGGYFIGIQPPSVLQDCSLQETHETDVKVFDEKSIYKMELENDIDSTKQVTFRKTDVNSTLPLKKRYISMMSSSFESASVKTESPIGNYSNSPMISIAALQPSNDVKLSPVLHNHQLHSGDIIRRDYVKEPINGYHYNDDRKRKQSNADTLVPIKVRKTSTDGGELPRPSKKVQEPKTPTKNSKRQTRLSLKKVPRVNYCYLDNETECNPSGESRRKRKRTSR